MTNPQLSKSDATRSRILMEAGQVFARKGYRATTVREICERASVNVASINYYFGDKQRLYNQTVQAARHMRIEEVPYPTWDEGTPPTEKLADFVATILERLVAMSSEPWQVRLLMREILEPTQACRNLIDDYFRPYFETLLHIIDDIAGRRLPEHRRQQIGFSILGQCLFYRFAADVTSAIVGEQGFVNHFGRDELANHITQFSLAAIEQMELGLHGPTQPQDSAPRPT